VAELLGWAANATEQLARRASDPAARRALYEEGLTLNARAGAAYPSDAPVRPIVEQRQRLLRAAGRADEAAAADRDLARATVPGPGGDYVRADADLLARRYREAADALEPLTRQGPASGTVWFKLGVARLGLHQYGPAADAFLVAGAIEPERHWPVFYRGVALLGAGRFEPSAAVLGEFIERMPGVSDAWMNRARARLRLNDAAGALSDLSAADRLGASPTRVHGLREMAHRAAGRANEADAERRALLAATPRDADDWTIRGEVRLASDPAGALADFDAALALEPAHPAALRGKASCLAEKLGRPADAARALERLLATGAATVEDRAGYAVLLARQGHAESARKQARACLNDDTPALPLYQAASALALTARTAADRAEVLAVLRQVVRRDATWAKHMPTDADLASVRADPEFRALMEAARVLTGPARQDPGR
jgi:tetratricopeptide (TPR) repeat protein